MDNWISVEERLPEVGIPVLIYTNDGASGERLVGQQSENYDGDALEWVNTVDWYRERATHWQPLPDPPRQGK